MSEANENMDYAQHQQTYDLFVGLVKYGVAAIVIILVLMAIFLI
jgi:Bacterial aa3 type cytochrome c oxidase subunit IV